VFILIKSIAPLQELFSPSPWLHFYDEYFFVNSQGVFGFINQRRAQPVMHFTHDPFPHPPSCRDSATSPFMGDNGKHLVCGELAPFCAHPQHGRAIRETCPATCGYCAAAAAPSASEAPSTQLNADATATAISWSPLGFKNLPGDPLQRPFFNSPFHYRFDWEVWIRTTASMDRASGDWHAVPDPLRAFIVHVLAGDTDATSLVSTNETLLRTASTASSDSGGHSGGGHSGGGGGGDGRRSGSGRGSNVTKGTSGVVPPTAIRLQYYWYTYSKPGTGAAWWERKPLGKPMVFTREGNSAKLGQHLPWMSTVSDDGVAVVEAWTDLRQSIMLLSVAGLVSALCCSQQILSRAGGTCAVLMTCFAVAFLSDYPALSPAPVRYAVQDWRTTCVSASAAWITGSFASFLVARRWASYRASDGVSEQRLMNFGAITQAACIVSILALLLRAQSIHAQATRA
jgi:hypothetical protein